MRSGRASRAPLCLPDRRFCDAFPDFRLRILSVTGDDERAAVRWALTGTFAGPGAFQGMEPTILARRFYSEVIGRAIGASMLRLWRVRYVVHRAAAPPSGQTIYISNHTSTIDVFLLIALALPRTRFFLRGFLRKIVPLGVIGYLIRIFWTVPQEFPVRRR